jgi:hypothetical protein
MPHTFAPKMRASFISFSLFAISAFALTFAPALLHHVDKLWAVRVIFALLFEPVI